MSTQRTEVEHFLWVIAERFLEAQNPEKSPHILKWVRTARLSFEFSLHNESVAEFRLRLKNKRAALYFWQNRHNINFPRELDCHQIVIVSDDFREVVREVVVHKELHPLSEETALEILRKERRPVTITLLTTTQEKARIMLCNQQFASVSGRSRKEHFYRNLTADINSYPPIVKESLLSLESAIFSAAQEINPAEAWVRDFNLVDISLYMEPVVCHVDCRLTTFNGENARLTIYTRF